MTPNRLLLIILVVPMLSCTATHPKDTAAAARAQAELLPVGQKELWQAAAQSGESQPIDKLRTDKVVGKRAPVRVSDRRAEPISNELAGSLRAGVALRELPADSKPYLGPATVKSVDRQLLNLDLGVAGMCCVVAKARGAALRIRAGERGQVEFRTGDPFARNDILGLKFEQDDFIHALVGNDAPITFKVETHNLLVEQVGQPQGNIMDVRITAGGQQRTARVGQEIEIPELGLTIKIVASVAVQGPSANALPGRPYRVEILGWRTNVGGGG